MVRKSVVRASFMVLTVLLLLLVLASPALAASANPANDIKDIGPELRAKSASIMQIDLSSLPASVGGLEQTGAAAVGDVKTWLGLNDVAGTYYFKSYTLRAIGTYGEVWVANTLNFPAGNPNNPVVISDEQAAYILTQFDNSIYPKDTAFFGTPDAHSGADSLFVDWGYFGPGYFDGDKVVILVDNIRDEKFYDNSYPVYIAGFYSPSYEAYFDRNIITIDAWDWTNRTGANASRPYLYEGVVAHELQHLIHDDWDPGEETFVNEGLSDFAEYVSGYQVATKSHVDAVATHPENSLVLWGDQGDLEILSDYGHAYLWTFYLYEKYGEAFIQAMVRNPDHGISGINSTLAEFNSTKTFADLYHDWTVALTIDSTMPGNGIYNFANLAFTLDLGTPWAPNTESYDTPGAPPWGTDYFWLQGDLRRMASFTFDGGDFSSYPTRWSSDGSVLWGGTGDLIDNWAIFSANGGGTLTFDTKYDIEPLWDYGFVQVSTDGGLTWTSLANASTTFDHDSNALPLAVENLPGLTGSTGGNWVNMSFDLSAYSGQKILIAFRYMTDWGTLEEGWYVDNVRVNGTLISNGSSVAPFKDITGILPVENDFTVSLVGVQSTSRGNVYKVVTMALADTSERGTVEIRRNFKGYNRIAVLVTADMPEGFSQYVDYTSSVRSAF